MIIIGLSGRKRSGKDTVCAIIQKLLANLVVKRVAFADPLKQEVRDLLGVTIEEIEADKVRFRGILQWWGTEWRRHQNNRYWIDQVDAELKRLKGSAEVVIFTDCRFKNEAEFIKSVGGIVVNVFRDHEKSDIHSSETDLDGWTFDYFIENKGTLIDLERNVARFIATQNIVSQNLQRAA